MENMFAGATVFNQPFGNWNTSNVLEMQGMFAGAAAFMQPIGNWNTSNVRNMAGMFTSATSLNQPIGNWNTSNVENMNSMFDFATSFNQPIGNWNTANVTSMYGMFIEAYVFNQDISNWNTSNVLNMNGMFANTYDFNQNIGNWNTSKVTDMNNMFYSAIAFNQNLGNWILHPDVDLQNMLSYSNLDCINYSATLIGWKNNNPTIIGRVLGADGLQYGTNANAARSTLLNFRGWAIFDFMMVSTPCLSTALPIELLTFIAHPQENNALLHWTTTAEINNEKFCIEHSKDGLIFNKIAEKQGKGTSSTKTEYQYKHEKINDRTHYYRLKQVDFDGKFTYSDIVKVAIEEHQSNIKVFPNPTSGEINFSKNVAAIYTIIDATGKIVEEGRVNAGSISIEKLPVGMYYLKLILEGKTETQKVWKY
jgi:surface protein